MRGRVALVASGGAIGTALRYLISSASQPDPGEVPWVTLVINLSGAFLLGILVAVLPRLHPGRLFFGTGVLGGYTTFGTVAVEVARLAGATAVAAVAYGTLSIIGGVLAAALGLAVGRRRRDVMQP